MKKWFAVVFVLLLCSAYPVHADVIGSSLSTEAGLKVFYADTLVDLGSVTGTTSALIEADYANSTVSDPAWYADAKDSWAYSLSTLSGSGDAATMGVDMRWDSAYSYSSYDSVNTASAGSGLKYEQDEGLNTELTVSWDLDYYLATGEAMDFDIVLNYSDSSPMGGTTVLGSISLNGGSNGITDSWTDSDIFNLGTLSSREFTLSIVGTSGYGSVKGFMTGDIDFTFGGGGSPTNNPVPEPSTMLLLGCGLIGLVLSRKNKKG